MESQRPRVVICEQARVAKQHPMHRKVVLGESCCERRAPSKNEEDVAQAAIDHVEIAFNDGK